VASLLPDARARAAESLSGAAEVWVREIERRVSQVKSGTVKLVDGKDARALILKRLAAKKK